MKREIIPTTATWTKVNMEGFVDNPTQWLSRQMREHTLNYLLAHADDGVIWGRLDGEEVITSHEVAPDYAPPLRKATLQTARIFARAGELLIWRDESGEWAGRLIVEDPSDATAEWTEAFDEQQILLGTNAEPRQRGFTVLSEGTQGLFHVVPLTLTEPLNEQIRPLRLVVRHYVKADASGFVRVNASRLRTLLPEPKESNT